MATHVLLMRHAQHRPRRLTYLSTDGEPSSCREDRELTELGKAETAEVAAALSQYLKENKSFKITCVVQAPSAEAKATTAELLRNLPDLDRVAVEEWRALTPARTRRYLTRSGNRKLDRVIDKLRGADAGATPPPGSTGTAVLVIGHQPLLGWLAFRRLGDSIPIASSEIICIALQGQRESPLWVLSPTDHQAIADLREKIRSKMGVAQALSGFITLGLTFLLGTLADKNRVEFLGVQIVTIAAAALLLFLAIVLYLATMYAYDALLMPRRFWGESPQGTTHRPPWIVARPPSSAQWILYQNMIRVWSRLFTPATGMVLLALFFAAYAVVSPKDHEKWLALPAAIGLAAALLFLFRQQVRFAAQRVRILARQTWGPWLGSED